MKNILFISLLFFSVESFSQVLYVPSKPDSLKVAVQVNGILRSIYVKDLLANAYRSISSITDTSVTFNKFGGGKDTLALSIGKAVDTLYRKAGIDSFYFRLAGKVYAVKDSTGGSSGGGSGVDTSKSYTWTNIHNFNSKISTSSYVTNAVSISPTMAPASNGLLLNALDINPTFNESVFTAGGKQILTARYSGSNRMTLDADGAFVVTYAGVPNSGINLDGNVGGRFYWNNTGFSATGSTLDIFSGGSTIARFQNGGNLLLGTLTNITNKILNVASNTKVSHPYPSMTSAQRLAITMTSDNYGDHVYQTDGTEGVYVYKSTGWQLAY